MTRKALPSYIVRNSAGVLYFRRGARGKWIKLETQFPEGNPIPFALHQERERLMRQPEPVKGGRDLNAILRDYKVTKLTKLKPRTRRDYEPHLAYFADKLGHLEPRMIERHHVIKWLHAWGAETTPHRANYRKTVLALVLEHAKDMGLLTKRDENPCRGVPALKYDRQDRLPWPASCVADFRSAYDYDTRERLCFELLLGTGQRIGDVLQMQWGHIKESGIYVRQNKTGKQLWVPFTQYLSAALDATPRASLFILAKDMSKTKTPGPWAYRSASQAMRKARIAIGAADYDLHGLRYTAAAELMAAGCDQETIAAVTGQSEAMVKHYTRATRQKVLALRAKEARE